MTHSIVQRVRIRWLVLIALALGILNYLAWNDTGDSILVGTWKAEKSTSDLGDNEMILYEDGRCIWSMTKKGVGTVRSGQYSLYQDTLQLFINSPRTEAFFWRVEFFENSKMILTNGDYRILYIRD